MNSLYPLRVWWLDGFGRAPLDVVVDQPDRLQQRVDDGGAHERETPTLQVFAGAVGKLRCRGQVGESSRVVHDRGSANPVPKIGCERPVFPLDADERLRILAGAVDLEPVANDAGVL